MPDRIKQIAAKLLELWNKYSKRQRIVFVSTIGAVLIAFIILAVVLNRTTYVELTNFENAETAASALSLLREQSITAKLGEENTQLMVDVKRQDDAMIALLSSSLNSGNEMTMQMLLDNDLNTTNYDRNLKRDLYQQNQIEQRLLNQVGIEKAEVSWYPAYDSGSILSSAREVACSVYLTINEEFVSSTAEALAVIIANELGNSDTEKIKILDQYSNLLYDGSREDDSELGVEYLLQRRAYTELVQQDFSERLYRLAVKNGFFDAEISLNLDINFDRVQELYTEYLPAEGQEQGLLERYWEVESENTGTSGDIPGTDPNDDVDYYIQNQTSGDSAYSEKEYNYMPSVRVTETMRDWGIINSAGSSAGLVLTNNVDVYEQDLRLTGVLTDEVTFDEYIANQPISREIELGEDYRELFSMASGIPVENIRVMAREVFTYIPMPVEEFDWSLILTIVLAALIIGLLVFVVFRGMKPEEVIEYEPELSIEQLLATTRENQSLEDIEYTEVSETRRMIEKFVEEKPEAVAGLLRNWLNEDWE